MALRSLRRRLADAKLALVPRRSLAGRVDALPDDLRAQWQIYVERRDAITAKLKNRGVNAFEAMLSDPLLYPPMPRALQHALWPEQAAVDREIAAGRIAEAYTIMLQGDDT